MPACGQPCGLALGLVRGNGGSGCVTGLAWGRSANAVVRSPHAQEPATGVCDNSGRAVLGAFLPLSTRGQGDTVGQDQVEPDCRVRTSIVVPVQDRPAGWSLVSVKGETPCTCGRIGIERKETKSQSPSEVTSERRRRGHRRGPRKLRFAMLTSEPVSTGARQGTRIWVRAWLAPRHRFSRNAMTEATCLRTHSRR